MPAVVDRKSIYKNWISEGFLILERLQDCGDTATSGCFFQPYLCKETDYSNARWQEAVLTLAMHCREYGGNEAIKQRIRSGILFWCSLQNIGGSFPQYCRGDKCFSATAFSGYAISAAIDLLGLQNINFTTEETIIVERVLKALGIWLSKNNEYVYSNQQMAASLALLMVSKVLNDEHLNQSSLKKLNWVLGRQAHAGYYPERYGLDYGYSTLTVEMLARYFINTKDNQTRQSILNSIDRFFSFSGTLINCNFDIRNTRGTDWIIVGGIEYFTGILEGGEDILRNLLRAGDVKHLPDVRHVCTDLYRLYFAYQNINTKIDCEMLGNDKVNYVTNQVTDAPRLNIFRPIGLHNVRRWLRWLLWAFR